MRRQLEWDNLRAVFGDWRQTVHAIMDGVPCIACDVRVGSPAVVEEAARLGQHPHLTRKTVFVVGPTGEAPALAAAATNPAGGLGSAAEDAVVPVLKAAGLVHTASPDGFLPPVPGLDFAGAREDVLAEQLRQSAGEAGRLGLVRELAGLNSEPALFHLAGLGLSDPSPAVCRVAADALLAAGGRAVSPLIASLDAPGRMTACFLLGQIADRRALPALRNVASRACEDPRVRDQAVWAIRRILDVNGGGDIHSRWAP
jgi:hypothetical protein